MTPRAWTGSGEARRREGEGRSARLGRPRSFRCAPSARIPFRSYTTRVQFDRGTGFIERAKRSGSVEELARHMDVIRSGISVTEAPAAA
jgi:hypothetical protein